MRSVIFHCSLNHMITDHFRLKTCFMTSGTQQGCKGRSRFSRKHVRYISYLSYIKPEINSRQSNKNGRFFRITSHTKCIHFVVIIDFYSAKVSLAGNTASTSWKPIGRKLFMTLRNQRLRFPESFAPNSLPFIPFDVNDLTMYIKGSRWRLHRNNKKSSGRRNEKSLKVENRVAQNK